MGMLSKITKLRKNRRFEYNPRFYDDKGKGNPYKIEPKFDQFRSTLNTSRGLKRKINSAIEDAKRKGDRNLKMRMVIIIERVDCQPEKRALKGRVSGLDDRNWNYFPMV